MFWAIYIAVLFAGVAMMVREGLWSNTITLINVIVSGLVAFEFYSPLTVYLDEKLGGEYTYVLDFVCIWALFVVTMLICRAVTDLASRTRMRFKNPIDQVGGPLVAIVTAWVLATFVMATLHTAPMGKNAFSGKLVHTESEVATNSGLTSPDLAWLRFVELMSRPDSLGNGKQRAFDAQRFVEWQADHREAFEKANTKWIRVHRG